MRAGRLFQEPVLHFLLIGIALFVLYGWIVPADGAGERIVVSQTTVDEIVTEFRARWSRAPSDQELAGLVDSQVRDEVLYREGLSLGLDRDDAVIKRRVRQKLEIIAEEQNAGDAPSDMDLAAYLAQNTTRFLQPAIVSFDQVLFDGEGPPASTERAIAAARETIARGANPTTLGKVSMLPPRVENAALDLVARDFGVAFAEQLFALPIAEWSGPLPSAFGMHLVRVTARAPAVLPPLESIRPLVAREWENARRENSLDAHYQQLRRKYDVVIEAKLPSPVAAQ